MVVVAVVTVMVVYVSTVCAFGSVTLCLSAECAFVCVFAKHVL